MQVRGRKGGGNENTNVVVTGRMSKVLTGVHSVKPQTLRSVLLNCLLHAGRAKNSPTENCLLDDVFLKTIVN